MTVARAAITITAIKMVMGEGNFLFDAIADFFNIESKYFNVLFIYVLKLAILAK